MDFHVCWTTLARMRLRRFSVSGYKNLRQPIDLDGLGPINLIHGANNVGKSNLLQAIALFFRCLVSPANNIPFSILDANAVADLVSDPRELFHLDRPAPIVLRGWLDIPSAELDAAGIQQASPVTRLEIELRLEWNAPGASVRITSFRFDGSEDVALPSASNEEKDRALRLARFVARNEIVRDAPAQRFTIVGVRRDLEIDKIQRPADSVPLALEMYDSRESPDRVRRDRWRAFVRSMSEFKDVTGDGTFEVTFQRSESVAHLMFDTDKMRIPFRLLGSGVQQVAALLGHLLMRNASIAAIEEPELNLRWDLQNRLREALKKLVGEPHGTGGLDQLFIASHSPAFETGEPFWLMEAGADGPVVSRRPAAELPMVLGSAPQHLELPERAPQAYVTSQGVVRLPPHAIERLRVERGGGVIFVDAEPRGVRILSNDDYLDELGLHDEDKDADAAS
jgi:AAA domain, putative AbiEii toxin, Type IV TA system